MITAVLWKLLYACHSHCLSLIGPGDSVECISMVSLTAVIPLQQHFHMTLFIYRFIYLRCTVYLCAMCFTSFFHDVTIKLKPLRTQLHRVAFFSYSAGRNLLLLITLMVKLFYGWWSLVGRKVFLMFIFLLFQGQWKKCREGIYAYYRARYEQIK